MALRIDVPNTPRSLVRLGPGKARPVVCIAALGLALLGFAVPGALAQGGGVSEATRERMAREWEDYWAQADKPLDLAVRPDERRRVTAAVGAAGGSLMLDMPEARFTLVIPADHLFHPSDITLTPVTGMTGLGDGQRTLSVQIGPSGLALAAPVWLHVAPKQPDALGGGFFAFGFSAGGRDAHYAWRSREGDGVAISVGHFSGFGLGLGSAANAALAQAKPRIAPPDATRTQKQAAEISRDDQAIGRVINGALAGETQTSEVDLEQTIRSFFGGGASGSREGAGDGRLPPSTAGNECSSLQRLIEDLNVWTIRDEKNPEANPRSSLTEDQWAALKRCAEPPAKICYDAGDPWPLVRYLKMVRLFRPKADEAARLKTILAWLEAELGKCAAYEMRIRTDSRVPDKSMTLESKTSATLKVALALSGDNKGKDSFVAEDKGRIEGSSVRCQGAACSVAGNRIEEAASLTLTLSDLPFEDQSGGQASARFSPLVEPAFARIDTLVKPPRGPSVTLPFETNYSFWRCHYASEFIKGAGKRGSPGLFKLKGWTSGSHPTLFQLRRARAKKTCEGVTSELGIELDFVHTPHGAFTPLN
jgi:hypothetical protein